MRVNAEYWPRSLVTLLGLSLALMSTLFTSLTGQATEQQSDASYASAQQRVPVVVTPEWEQRLNLRSETVRRDLLTVEIRATATVIPAEDRVSHVHTRVAGWIEELYVHTTGEWVQEGQPLASIFSQELYASQLEYLATRGARSGLSENSRRRLQIMGMSEQELSAVERQGTARHLVTLVAPRSGVVLRRSVSPGTAVDPATELLTIADLGMVWVMAEVAERDIPMVKPGMPAVIEIPAAGKAIAAQVDFVYPTVNERTRSLGVRIKIENNGHLLRPGMTGTVKLLIQKPDVLSVPRDAVVDTGDVQHVFVVAASGSYEPRAVRTGMRTGSRIEVLMGLEENEKVLSSGVFLIDSESRLRGSGGGVGHGAHGSGSKPTPTPSAENPHQGH